MDTEASEALKNIDRQQSVALQLLTPHLHVMDKILLNVLPRLSIYQL